MANQVTIHNHQPLDFDLGDLFLSPSDEVFQLSLVPVRGRGLYYIASEIGKGGHWNGLHDTPEKAIDGLRMVPPGFEVRMRALG